MFKKIFENRRKKQQSIRNANMIYGILVAQARKPIFYTTHSVADTIDGRFDMVALHLFIVLRRLDSVDGGRLMQQGLADITIADMDQAIRELGVGDTGVAKRIQIMAQAFWGRFEAYNILEQKSLASSVIKNVFRGDATKTKQANALAAYIIAQIEFLNKQDDLAILKGTLKFNEK